MNSKVTLGITSKGNPLGKTIVITHGFGTDSNFLTPFIDILKDYNLIFVDMPGYGKSKHLFKDSLSFEDKALLLLNTIPNDSILITWSLSTLFGIKAASMDNNNKIRKLITVCGSPKFPQSKDWPGFSYEYLQKCADFSERTNDNRVLKLFFRMQMQGASSKFRNFILDKSEHLGEIDLEVLKADVLTMLITDVRDELYKLKIPCLHIFGGKDKLVNKDLFDILKTIDNHKCALIEDSAHMPFLSHDLELSDLLKNFI